MRNCDHLRRRQGLGLAEILLAAFLLVIAIIPMYRSYSDGVVKEIDTLKLSMARKVLESLRNELTNQPFKDIAAIAAGSSSPVSFTAGYPKTISDVLTVQQQYKDFTLDPTIKAVSPTVLEIRGVVKWTGANNAPKEESLTFMLIRP